MTGIRRVLIGQWAIAKGAGVLEAAGIGSCVCLVVRSRQAGVLGMAHVLLPQKPQGFEMDENRYPARYAEQALTNLLAGLDEAGVQGATREALLVGGANMFFRQEAAADAAVGDRNVAALREALERHGVPLIAQDVGGTRGRTVSALAETGEVWVRTVRDGRYLVG